MQAGWGERQRLPYTEYIESVENGFGNKKDKKCQESRRGGQFENAARSDSVFEELRGEFLLGNFDGP